MQAIEKIETADGRWRVRVHTPGWEFVYETELYPTIALALKEARRWSTWAENLPSGKADSIYYILVIPETWFPSPVGAHPFSGLHIKIGRAKDALKRLQNLKTGTSGELIIMALEPGGAAVERARHKQFASDRRQGEWFVCSPKLAQHAWNTWRKNNLLPPEHQARLLRLANRLEQYRQVREIIGKTPEMINPSINEEWRESTFVDLVNTSLIQKDGLNLEYYKKVLSGMRDREAKINRKKRPRQISDR